ncbi:MAG: 5'/3'-nucleotidase SurE, partial [Casimicrobium sp.]
MRILVSNDDGYQAPGIEALVASLREVAEVTVVAPSRDRSATSNSITVHRALTIERAANGFYFIDGKPADCVHVAVTGFFDFKPDLVVSGINNGSNLGDDTIYSGTVAAAMEGYLLGIPGIALSMTHKPSQHFASGARVARELVERVMKTPPSAPWLLNVNIPDAPYASIKGYRTVRLGKRHQAEPVERVYSKDGIEQWKIGGVGPAADAGPETDFGAVAENYVSVTPVSVDLTQYAHLRAV